jgi:predicted DNA-binding transcriptional regulator AlpA
VASLIDPDDLIDTTAIAELLGLASHRVVSVLRSRHEDFPDPTVDMGRGRCLLWLRQDVEAWARSTGRL